MRAAVVGYKRLTPLLYGYLSKTFSINEVDQMEEVRTKKKWMLFCWYQKKNKCVHLIVPIIGEVDHDSSISSQNFGLQNVEWEVHTDLETYNKIGDVLNSSTYLSACLTHYLIDLNITMYVHILHAL